MKTKSLFRSLLIATALFSFACKKKKEDVVADAPKKVYFISKEETGTNGNFAVKYAAEGLFTTLINGTTEDGRVIDMAVSGTDVYTLATRENTTTFNEDYVVFKNATVIQTFPESGPFFPAAIAVNGSDLYIAGLGNEGAAAYAKVRVWKNGTLASYSDGSREADVYTMTVVNNDVYVGGYLRNTSGVKVATYWKNGTAVSMNSAVSSTDIYDLAVVNNDVYAAGSSGSDKPLYWKNGVETQLSTNNGLATCIAVSGNDVYVGGELQTASGYQATYWKNGTPVTISTGTISGFINDIALDGSTVYAGGYVTLTAGTYRPAYWKNGTQTIYGAPGNNGEIYRVIAK